MRLLLIDILDNIDDIDTYKSSLNYILMIMRYYHFIKQDEFVKYLSFYYNKNNVNLNSYLLWKEEKEFLINKLNDV